MRESEYWANIELARGVRRTRHAQVYKPAKPESRALAVTLAIACGAVIGTLLALGV
jgi:hypothetical protein